MVITYKVEYMSRSCGVVTLEVRTIEHRKPWVHVHVEDISQVSDGIADWYGSWDRLPTWFFPAEWDYCPLSSDIAGDLRIMCDCAAVAQQLIEDLALELADAPNE